MSDFQGNPTFGVYIRAARLGYYWVPGLKFFIKISGDGPFLVEIAPPIATELKGKPREMHRVLEDPYGILALSPALSALDKAPKQYTKFILDDNGEMI